MTYGEIPFVYGLMQEVSGSAEENSIAHGGAGLSSGFEQKTGTLPGTGGIFDPNALAESGILKAQAPPLSLTGRGVLIGFADTGIRYEMNVFRRSDGGTRIAAAWDQEADRYYTEREINEALQSGQPRNLVPLTDETGHGTAMASIAAGSRIDEGRSFTGAAPDSRLLVVKLRQAPQSVRDYYFVPDGAVCFDEDDIIAGIRYLDEQAELLGLPLVICFGLGTNLNAHSGSSELERLLDQIALKLGRAVVVCSGNEGNKQHHFAGNFNRGSFFRQDQVRLRRDMEIRVSEGVKGFTLSVWGTQPYQFQFSLRSPGGETIRDIRFHTNETLTYRFVYEKAVLYLDADRVETGSGAQLLFLRFADPDPGIWTLTAQEEEQANYALFHAWLPIEAFLTAPVTFLEPSPYVSLTGPSAAMNTIGVSAYDDFNNSFSPESGRGYTRDGRAKPDIAAPGVNVSTILGKRSGSSMAAAITAGGAAQILQWAVTERNLPRINATTLKNELIRGAIRDLDIVYPSQEWGYGRLSVSGVYDRMRE